MSFFSIIVPTYNRSDLIVHTLDSIRTQTFVDYEVIIVDDGSTDNTELIIRNYIQHFSLNEQFRYIMKENGERAAARNFGTRYATGSYVNWFDSDDLMDNEHLESTFKKLQNLQFPSVIVAGYRIQDHEGTVFERSNYANDIRSVLYRGNFFACSPVFVHKKIALQNPFNEDRKLSGSEDYELWLRIASKVNIHCISEHTITIVQHDGRSVNTMQDKDRLIERFTKFIHYTTSNSSITSFLGKNINHFIMKNYLLLAVELAANKHRKSSWKYLIQAGRFSWQFIFQRSFYATIKHLFLS